jgi:hypothetical protein
MFRRTAYIFLLPVASTILLFFAAWGYIVTHQQQVDSYLSEQLSHQLGTPLTLQNATLGLHPAPTIDFDNIRLNAPEHKLQLTIPQLHIGLSWRDLIKGNLVIAKLVVVHPDIYWQTPDYSNHNDDSAPTKPPAAAAAEQQPHAEQQISTLLRKAKITDATLHLITSVRTPTGAGTNQDNPVNTTWELHHLNASLISRTAEQVQISFSANLRQPDRDDARIEFSCQIQDARSCWLSPPQQLDMHLNNISSATLSKFDLAPAYQLDQLNGAYNLQLNLNSQNRSSLHAIAQIEALQPEQTLSIGKYQPIPIKNISLDTSVIWDTDKLQFAPLQLGYNELIITATASINNIQGKQKGSPHLPPHLHMQLSSNSIDISSILALAPATLIEQLPQDSAQAQLQCQNLVIDGPLQGINSSAIKQAQFTLKHPNLNYHGLRAPQLVASIDYTGDHGTLTTSPLTMDSDGVKWVGPLKLNLNKLDQGKYQLSTDLTPVDIQAVTLIHKSADEDGQISFNLKRSTKKPTCWIIDNGQLEIPDYTLFFAANYINNHDYQAEIQLPHYSLETISAKIPLLNYMQLRGDIAARYQLNKKSSQPLQGQGQVILTDCAIAPTYVIAPIHHINGTIELNDFSAQADDLALILGSSPMQVDAHIADLRHTVAELNATGDKVIAQDLVFNNPNILLKNLYGRIDIHKHGIDFIHASVELPQGTSATVKGKLKFNQVALALDIDAPYADINEVIALWQNDTVPSSAITIDETQDSTEQSTESIGDVTQTDSAQQQPLDVQREFIHINAHVAKGLITGFEFQNAQGQIHYQHGQLRIEPLHFTADSGNGNGSILVISPQEHTAQGQHSLLKIVGAVDNIDADKVYRQLLKHNGMVTGQLSGEFSINGSISSSFLANSNGDFHINIKRGVLREFKFISKAFSLLNVAQLFALNLPDMDKQGMPFSQLTSDITLTNGTLHTDNLTIKSEAMGLGLIGDHNLVNNQLDLIMDIKPLGTIDSVVNNIPVAGWILSGDEKTFISSNFSVTGSATDPNVSMMPIRTVTNKLFGIFERTIKLPAKLFNKPIKILTNSRD